MELDTQIVVEGIQRHLRAASFALEPGALRHLIDEIQPELESLGLRPLAGTILPAGAAAFGFATDANYEPEASALGELCRAGTKVVTEGNVPVLRVIDGSSMLSCFSQNHRDWIVLKAEQEHANLLSELQEDFWFAFFG